MNRGSEFCRLVPYHLAIPPFKNNKNWSEKRGSNPRPPPWQGGALSTELFSHFKNQCYYNSRFFYFSQEKKVNLRLIKNFLKILEHRILHFFFEYLFLRINYHIQEVRYLNKYNTFR